MTVLAGEGSADLPDLKAGVYQHYKGEHYLVLGYAHDASIDQWQSYSERMVVVYVPLYVSIGLDPSPRMAVRDVDDFFFEHMHGGLNDDGPMWTECRPGCPGEKDAHRPRFRYIGPSA